MGAANGSITNRAVGHNHFALLADERDARIRDMLDEYMELKFVGFDDSGNLVFHVTAHSLDISYAPNADYRWEIRIKPCHILMRQFVPVIE